jgi:glucokinase
MNITAPEVRPWLVADVGGTNARFGLAQPDAPDLLDPESIRVVRVANFQTPSAAALHYLAEVRVRPVGAVLAVAGPTDGRTAQLTNHRWSFSASELQVAIDVGVVTLINDFAAVAYAVQALRPSELGPLGSAVIGSTTGEGRTFAVLGPGTGLGVAALTYRNGLPVVLETEGGHASFAPITADEVAILGELSRHFDRVSWERLLCGSGLANLRRSLSAIAGLPIEDLPPEAITAGAKRGDDPLSLRTVELFCELLGSFAGDVTLLYGAWDGVLLGGGLPQQLKPWLTAERFRRRFENKGRFATALARVPSATILHPYPGLLGAAGYASFVAQRR